MYLKIVEINSLIESEEIVKQFKRSPNPEQAKEQAKNLAFQRWQVIPKALGDGWQHPHIPHLRMVIR